MSEPCLADYTLALEQLAASQGLDYYPVRYELVPHNFMLEIAVYGMPVRMRHWSFGLRYIHQLTRQNMGHSRIFEVMFPGDPCRAFLLDSNSLAENVLVAAHVLGHADFAKRNALFTRFMAMAGGHILEQSAVRARRIERALAEHGQARVEAVLDAALALDQHIDIHQPLYRPPYNAGDGAAQPSRRRQAPDGSATAPALALPDAAAEAFRRRYRALPGEPVPPPASAAAPAPALPPHPESDLLWFIARHGPELRDWERDIFLAVREEAYFFYPVHACQIMNEGWASYWHARLLREANFLPPHLYLDAARAHSDVVRPYAGEQQLALALNPYHLGFCMWQHIIEGHGLAAARRICAEEDDFGFIRNYLDRDLAEQLDLFAYTRHGNGESRVASRELHAVREAILAPKYHYGAPTVTIERMHDDGSLELRHDHRCDGRGLELASAEQVLGYVARIWRRPVLLHTVDFRGAARTLRAGPAAT